MLFLWLIPAVQLANAASAPGPVTAIDLGTLGGSLSVAEWVNDNGMVVGYSDLPGEIPNPCGVVASHAFAWTHAEGMVDLGTLGGMCSRATAINNQGMVVGGSSLPGEIDGRPKGKSHAFVWTQGGGMVDIGTFGGNYSSAVAINNNGMVVGFANRPAFREGLWEAWLQLHSRSPPQAALRDSEGV